MYRRDDGVGRAHRVVEYLGDGGGRHQQARELGERAGERARLIESGLHPVRRPWFPLRSQEPFSVPFPVPAAVVGHWIAPSALGGSRGGDEATTVQARKPSPAPAAIALAFRATGGSGFIAHWRRQAGVPRAGAPSRRQQRPANDVAHCAIAPKRAPHSVARDGVIEVSPGRGGLHRTWPLSDVDQGGSSATAARHSPWPDGIVGPRLATATEAARRSVTELDHRPLGLGRNVPATNRRANVGKPASQVSRSTRCHCREGHPGGAGRREVPCPGIRVLNHRVDLAANGRRPASPGSVFFPRTSS